MPKPTVIPASEMPRRTPPAGRGKSPERKVIQSSLEESLATIHKLKPDQALLFHLDDTDDPSFRTTGATVNHLKDRFRRLFRMSMEDLGLTPQDYHVRYELIYKRTDTDQVLATGFKAYLSRKHQR
jgi:hypothetical protein